MSDASYKDVDFSDQPLRLSAVGPDDLAVVSTLVQDAVGRTGEMSWMPRRRRLAILLNRFRWEDRAAAERDRRPYERVRAALLFDSVLAVRARGIDPSDRQAPLALLRVDWQPDAVADAADEANGDDTAGESARDEGADIQRVAAEEAAPDNANTENAGTEGADFESPGSDAPVAGVGGRILLALAGGGEIALHVECVDACLVDLTRPWESRTGHAPDHSLEEMG